MPRITMADLRAKPPGLSDSERARLDAMTSDEIDRNAKTDPENPEMTDDELDCAVFARSIRQAREKAGLTQSVFAERFHISLSRLRDWELGRNRPDSAIVAYSKAIRHDPKAIELALEAQD